MKPQEKNNHGTVTGVLRRLTDYELKADHQKMQRIDVVVPSTSPLEHPTTVSVHTSSIRSKDLINKEICLTFRPITFLKTGKGKGAGELFDSTRLEEVAA
jgi:hypothetical protein